MPSAYRLCLTSGAELELDQPTGCAFCVLHAAFKVTGSRLALGLLLKLIARSDNS